MKFGYVYVVGIIVCWIGIFIVSVFWEKERRKTGNDYVLIPFLFLGFGWPVALVLLIPACVFISVSRIFSFFAGKIVDLIDRQGVDGEHKED